MGSKIGYGGIILKETSQMLLQSLYDRGGEAIASELRDDVQLDYAQQVHYRLKEYLIPAGLVERATRREMPGNTRNAIVYGLTDEGRSFVEVHREELSRTVDTDAVLQSYRRVSEEVSGCQDRMDRALFDIDRLQSRQRLQGEQIDEQDVRLSRLEAEVDDLNREQWWREADETDLPALREKVAGLTERVDDLRTDVESLRDAVDWVGLTS